MLFKVSNYDHHNLRPTVYFNFLSTQEELCKSSIWNCICIKDKSLKFPSETEDTLYNFHFFWKDSTYTLTDRLQHIFVLWLTTQMTHGTWSVTPRKRITLHFSQVMSFSRHHITSHHHSSSHTFYISVVHVHFVTHYFLSSSDCVSCVPLSGLKWLLNNNTIQLGL